MSAGGFVSHNGGRTNGYHRGEAKFLEPKFTEGHVPPHDLDAEAAVISAIILAPDRLGDLMWLRPEHFYSEAHNRIWEAILELQRSESAIDVTLVGNWLKNNDRIEQVGGMSYLTQLLHSAPAVANAEPYARAIEELSRVRRLIARTQVISARGYLDARSNAHEYFVHAEEDVLELTRNAKSALRRIGVDEMLRPRPPEPNYLCKGLLLAPGRANMSAGAPDSGKTITMQSFATCVAAGVDAFGSFHVRRGLVVHLNWDQPREATETRYTKIHRGLGLTTDDTRGYLELIDDPPFTFDNAAAFGELRSICRGAALVIIDALTGALGDVDENSPAVGRVLRKIGKISEQTGCVILIIHHASKPPPSYKGKKPDRDPMHDVRGSGSIGGACDALFMQNVVKKGEIYAVRMARTPTFAKRSLDPFGFLFEDIDGDGKPDPSAVRISYMDPEQFAAATERPKKEKADDSSQRASDLEQRAQRLLEMIKAQPGISSSLLEARAPSMHKAKFNQALEHLFETKRVACRRGTKFGDRKPKEWVAT